MRRSVAGIVVKDGRLLVARRTPGGALGGKWEFPGGKVEEGESDQEALSREFLEELSVGARVGTMLTSSSFSHGSELVALCAYLVTLEPGEIVLADHTEYRWATLDEIVALDFAESDLDLLPDLRLRLG